MKASIPLTLSIFVFTFISLLAVVPAQARETTSETFYPGLSDHVGCRQKNMMNGYVHFSDYDPCGGENSLTGSGEIGFGGPQKTGRPIAGIFQAAIEDGQYADKSSPSTLNVVAGSVSRLPASAGLGDQNEFQISAVTSYMGAPVPSRLIEPNANSYVTGESSSPQAAPNTSREGQRK